MARLIKDPVGNEQLISWLRIMFPEARADSVLRPAENTRDGWWTRRIKPSFLTNSLKFRAKQEKTSFTGRFLNQVVTGKKEASMTKILVVDDEKYIGELLSAEWEDEGYSVESVKDAEWLSEHLDANLPDLVLLDLHLKGFEGWSILHNIKEKNPNLPVLIFTAYDTFAEDPRLSKADGYVIKSLDGLDELKKKISKLIGRTLSRDQVNEIVLEEGSIVPFSSHQIKL